MLSPFSWPSFGLWRTVVLLDRQAGLQVEARSPGDAVHERPGVDDGVLLPWMATVGLGELFAVGHEEEAIAVGVRRGLDGLAALGVLVIE